MSDLGRPMAEVGAVRRQPTVSFDLPIQRRSLLELRHLLLSGLQLASTSGAGFAHVLTRPKRARVPIQTRKRNQKDGPEKEQ